MKKYEEELIKLKKIIDDKFRNQDGTYEIKYKVDMHLLFFET